MLHLQIANLRLRVWFEVVDTSAVDLLLSKSFIDKYIRGISPTERKLVL